MQVPDWKKKIRPEHNSGSEQSSFYYRTLKGVAHKWLDLVALSQAVLPTRCTIERVNYYTANISGRTDLTVLARLFASARVAAAGERPYGISWSRKWAGRVPPPEFRPTILLLPRPSPEVAWVWKTEEKVFA